MRHRDEPQKLDAKERIADARRRATRLATLTAAALQNLALAVRSRPKAGEMSTRAPRRVGEGGERTERTGLAHINDDADSTAALAAAAANVFATERRSAFACRPNGAALRATAVHVRAELASRLSSK